MTVRLSDIILALGVGAALVTTGSAIHDLGRPLPRSPGISSGGGPGPAPGVVAAPYVVRPTGL